MKSQKEFHFNGLREVPQSKESIRHSIQNINREKEGGLGVAKSSGPGTAPSINNL